MSKPGFIADFGCGPGVDPEEGMNRPAIIAVPCAAGQVACPGAHACMFQRAGNWRACSAVMTHERPVPNQGSRTDEERAA